MRPTVRAIERRSDKGAGVVTALAVATLLATSATAAAQAPAANSAPAADQTAEGPVVSVQADRIVNDDKNRQLIAEGAVEARYEGRTLRASKLVYDFSTRRIRVSGGVQITEADGLVRSADEMELDEEFNEGVATRFGATFPGGGVAAASGAIRRADGRNELRDAIYTACPICKAGEGPGPTWTLSARRAVQDPNSKMIEYRDAVLKFGDVPVVYLPFFAHPDPSAGPRSGFLPPDLGQNRRHGAFYEQPNNRRIAPDQDVVISPRVHSQVNPLVGFEYRKRFWSGQVNLEGSITNEKDFDTGGDKFGDASWRGHLFGTGKFKVNEFWDWGFGVERASDDLYLRRYDLPGAGQIRGPFVGDQLRLLSQAYAIGQDKNTYANVSLISYQGLRATDDSRTLPLILPFAEIEHVTRDPLLDGQLRLQGSTAVLVRGNEGVDQARVSVGADWRRDDVIGGGLVLGSFAQARADAYRITDAVPGVTKDVSRTLGLIGAELRYPLVRRDAGFTTLVEPIVMVAIGSSDDDGGLIVNEDSQAFELDDSNLFRPNAAPNYDLWEPDQRVSAGVRATVTGDNGHSASAVFGRRWRSEADPRFGVATNLNGLESDFVGALSADLGPGFGARVRFRLDDQNYSLSRLDASVRATVGAVSGDVRYFNIDQTLRPGDPNEEVRVNASVQLNKNWSVGAGVQRDLDSDITLGQNVRVLYQDDCTLLEFSYVRSETQDRRLGPNEGFQVRLGLKTLGVFGGS